MCGEALSLQALIKIYHPCRNLIYFGRGCLLKTLGFFLATTDKPDRPFLLPYSSSDSAAMSSSIAHIYSLFFTFSFLQRTQVQISVPGCVPGLCFMMLPQRGHFSPVGTVMGFASRTQVIGLSWNPLNFILCSLYPLPNPLRLVWRNRSPGLLLDSKLLGGAL